MDSVAVPLVVACRTDKGRRAFKLHEFGRWVGPHGTEAVTQLKHYRHGCAWYSIQASIGMLNAFASYCLDNKYPFTQEPGEFQDLLRLFHEHFNRRPLADSTKPATWNHFTSVVAHLQWKGFFPKSVVPKAFYKSQQAQRALRQKINHLGLTYAEYSSARSGEEFLQSKKPFPDSRLLAVGKLSSDEEWLDAYFDDLQTCFDTIRAVALDEVAKAEQEFAKGNELIETADLARVIEIYNETGDLCDRPAHLTADDANVDRGRLATAIETFKQTGVITPLQAEGLRAILLFDKTATDFGTEQGKTGSNGRIVVRNAKAALGRIAESSEEACFLLEMSVAAQGLTTKRRMANRKTSLFCPKRPDGLANLLAWADHVSSRVAVRSRGVSSFPGAHHIDSYGSERVRRLLGLTPVVAVAMQAVIVSETGLNLEVVRNMEVDKNGDVIGLTPTDNPLIYVYKGTKRRAKRKQTGIFRVPEDGEINAYQCLQFAVRMTAPFRERSGLRRLWQYCISPPMAPRSFLMSDTMLKHAWHEFVQRNSVELGPLVQRRPELGQLRVTAGLLDWYNSGGSKEKAAQKLGNTVGVAVRHYIPTELQDALYRRQIRRFQDLLIITATRESDFSCQALNVTSEEELAQLLEQLGGSKDVLRGEMTVKRPAQPSRSKDPKGKRLAFTFSPRNVAIILAFRDRLQRLHLSDPKRFSYDHIFAGCSLREWSDFANAIEMFGEVSGDRGHRVALKRARRLVEKNPFHFRFGGVLDAVK